MRPLNCSSQIVRQRDGSRWRADSSYPRIGAGDAANGRLPCAKVSVWCGGGPEPDLFVDAAFRRVVVVLAVSICIHCLLHSPLCASFIRRPPRAGKADDRGPRWRCRGQGGPHDPSAGLQPIYGSAADPFFADKQQQIAPHVGVIGEEEIIPLVFRASFHSLVSRTRHAML